MMTQHQNCKKMLSMFTAVKDSTKMREFTELRDWLMLSLCSDICSGANAKMTLEVRKAKKENQDYVNISILS